MYKSRIVIFVLIMVSVIGCVASADTDIFGDSRQFVTMYNSRNAVVRAGFTPIENFSWGLSVQGILDEGVNQDHAKWTNTLIGPYIDYPFISIKDITKVLPIDGTGYMGASLLWDAETNTDLFAVFEAGVRFDLTPDISAQLSYQYCKRDDLFKENDRWLLGVCLSWK